VATHGNALGPDGKEGVDGSSPSEGLHKSRLTGIFVQKDLLFVARAVGMEPFVELSRGERVRSLSVKPARLPERALGQRRREVGGSLCKLLVHLGDSAVELSWSELCGHAGR
jgi:hypothetical protein